MRYLRRISKSISHFIFSQKHPAGLDSSTRPVAASLHKLRLYSILLPMLWINDFVAALAFSQLTLLGAYFSIKFSGYLSRLIALYSICLGAYLLTLMSFADNSPFTAYILYRLAILAPIALWFIAYAMFVDNRGKLPVIWLAIAYLVLARGIGMGIALVEPRILVNQLGYFLIIFLPQTILLGFSLHIAYLGWSGYQFDLLEQRRRVRMLFAVVMGIIVITVVGADFVFFAGRYVPLDWFLQFYPIPPVLVSAYVLFAAFALNISIFRLDGRALDMLSNESASTVRPVASEKKATELESRQINQMHSLMQDQKLYTQHGLTIADLSDALNLQEYRVRRLINQQLGYRNFNQFLNNYRIEDARNRLLESDMTISNIALEVGYASLSVFNKAFKDRYDLTPREYRLQHKPDSGALKSPA